MHAKLKFQVAWIQNKRDSHSSLDLPVQVQVTWGFLASDGSEIQSGADDFRSIN